MMKERLGASNLVYASSLFEPKTAIPSIPRSLTKNDRFKNLYNLIVIHLF